MDRVHTVRHAAWAALAMAAFIVYGSLYPFDFRMPADLAPVIRLLASWRMPPHQFGNLIGNVFLYLPFGLFGALALRARARHPAAFWGMLVLGTLLSLSMELIQCTIPGRVSTFADIYPNALGTGLGAFAGLIVARQLPRLPVLTRPGAPVPLLLLAAFFAYRLFPYVPSLDLHQYWHAVKPLLTAPVPPPYETTRYAVMWLTVAGLGSALIGARGARHYLALVILAVLAAQVAIVDNRLNAAEIAGAAIALVLWPALSRLHARPQALALALLLATLVAGERLQPFRLSVSGHGFGWVPFLSFLHGSMAMNTQSFLEKFFLYGSLIWLTARAGAGLAAAGCAAAIGLLITSLVQTHLPGRSAEITDALMALAIAGLFALLQRPSDTRAHAGGH